MMDMYYPDTSDDDEKFFIPFSDTFITSWCRNGHNLRIEPEAVVYYIQTFNQSPMHPMKNLQIRRNGHGHPDMQKGIVQVINHADKTVQIISAGSSGPVTVDWDLVVGREDSRHQSIPVALMGTNEAMLTFCNEKLNLMRRRTLDFDVLRREMSSAKPQYTARLLGFTPPKGSLAALAFQALVENISLKAAEKRESFFAAAERMLG